MYNHAVTVFWLPVPFKSSLQGHCISHTHTHTHLVDEADGGRLAAIQEVNINDLQLLQADVEGLELAVVAVQRDHLEKAIIQPQPDHPALRVHYANDAGLRGAADAVLSDTRHHQHLVNVRA